MPLNTLNIKRIILVTIVNIQLVNIAIKKNFEILRKTKDHNYCVDISVLIFLSLIFFVLVNYLKKLKTIINLKVDFLFIQHAKI